MTDEMEQPEPMIKVKALKMHTTAGVTHEEGDEYEVKASEVGNLIHLGMAAPEEKPA